MPNPTRLALLLALTSALTMGSAGAASASLTNSQRCLDAKHKAVGRHDVCLLKEYGAAAAHASTPDYSDCDADLATAFADAETRYGASCRTTGDASVLATRGANLVTGLDTLLDPASAVGADALACVLAKVKAAAKRAACGEKAEGLLIKKDLVERDSSVCDAKLTSAFTKIEAEGGCPAGGAASDVRAAVDSAFGEGKADLADLGTADFYGRGRYRVSTRTMTFVDASRPTKANGTYPGAPDRTLVVTIWYPAASTLPNYPLAPASSPFPLVIRAHGFGAFRNDSTNLTMQLASRGMIVVAPDFPLSNLNSPGGAILTDFDQQIVDVSYLIDRMLALNTTPGSPFEGRVDPARIGVIGHSLGGATVLGAGYHPTLHDSRIRAVVALAPFACIYEESFFDGGGTAPLMILSGSADLVTRPTSNQIDVFGRANPEKYLVNLDGGLHIGFADDFLNDDSENADEVLACPALLPPGAPRPATLTFDVPPDFLGGAAAGVDLTGSTCEPLCPLPTATWMAHDRQRDIELAAATAMFAKVFSGDVSADRLITDRLDSENADVTLAYER